ncbi:MAG: hypothetical protein ACI9BV_001657, partial [Rhodothermales bacterium]
MELPPVFRFRAVNSADLVELGFLIPLRRIE